MDEEDFGRGVRKAGQLGKGTEGEEKRRIRIKKRREEEGVGEEGKEGKRRSGERGRRGEQ